MKKCIIRCPCCDIQLSVLIDDSGLATVFLLEENMISQSELAQDYGIEFGIEEVS